MTYTRYYHIAYYLYAYGQNSYKTGKISTKHAVVAFTTQLTPLYQGENDVFLCVLPSGLLPSHNRCHYDVWYIVPDSSTALPVYILIIRLHIDIYIL